MPTLEELRRWGAGKRVEGLPTQNPLKTGPDKSEKMAARGGRSTHQYKINATGTDALLLIGKHKGRQVSELANDRESRSYLRWLRKKRRTTEDPEGFDDDLIDVVDYVLKNTKMP